MRTEVLNFMSIEKNTNILTVSQDLKERGLIYQYSDEKLFDLIDNGEATAYVGFDPTSDSLHLGNLIQLLTLRRLQVGNNKVIVLAGGGTGMIGDPSGKTSERVLLTIQEIQENVSKVRSQLEAFVDFSSSASGAELVNNFDWLSDISILDFLRDIGKHMTVNQMVAKDSVKSRIEGREQGISFTEFSYMLLQATDFLHLSDKIGCNLQLGASDQWGNITAGIELVRRSRARQVFGLTTPLLLKEDGTKFGKSESGAIFLDPDKTSPYEFYQYFLRSPDSEVIKYLKFFTFLELSEINELSLGVQQAPEAREAQRRLAQEVTRIVHGDHVLGLAERASEALFSDSIRDMARDVVAMALKGAPSISVTKEQFSDGISVLDIMVRAGMVDSKSVARKLISQGGVYVNNVRCQQIERELNKLDLLSNDQVLLRKGKRDYLVIEVEI